MTEHTFTSGSMVSMACGRWESLLADALDGVLRPEDEAFFAAHRSACPACAALCEEARRGQEWLKFLSPAPEPPAGLFDKILAETGPGQLAGYGLSDGEEGEEGEMAPQLAPAPAWRQPGLAGSERRLAAPRLLMTAAMAFFSLTLTLNVSGVRLSSLRPDTVRELPGVASALMERRLTTASTPIIRYYDHLHLPYEVQSRVRELRRAAEAGVEEKPQNAAPGESRQLPEGKTGGAREDAYESSALKSQRRPAYFSGSAEEIRRGNTAWIASITAA